MIPRRKKICEECGRLKYLWSDGKCKLCATLASGKRLSNKPRRKTGELEMFKKIWDKRKHKSQLSGKKLEDFDIKYFAHIVPKGKYPELRLEQWNIYLLTPYEHHLYDNGTEEQREKYCISNDCDWRELYKYRDEIRAHGKILSDL